MGCELIRHRDFRKMAASIQTFFKGMGDQFANTVTLIVAGETFAFGLTSLGIVKEFVAAIQGLAISADAVSYTHLDVYKRQPYSDSTNKRRASTVSAWVRWIINTINN